VGKSPHEDLAFGGLLVAGPLVAQAHLPNRESPAGARLEHVARLARASEALFGERQPWALGQPRGRQLLLGEGLSGAGGHGGPAGVGLAGAAAVETEDREGAVALHQGNVGQGGKLERGHGVLSEIVMCPPTVCTTRLLMLVSASLAGQPGDFEIP